MYKRPIFNKIHSRIKSNPKFIQVLLGPRQVGKTTLAKQISKEIDIFCHYASADGPMLKNNSWIESQWAIARGKVNNGQSVLLILDEIQKLDHWSEIVKKLWDEDRFNDIPLLVMLLGSSHLLIKKGLDESLAGRFELSNITHWSFSEMRDAFGITLDQYIYFGGYPGSFDLINDEDRWKNYIQDALIETTISRDLILMNRIEKPALLRRLFFLGCEYSGKILSFQKMTGQLQEAGNTTTLSHYLTLLDQISLLGGLQKFCGEQVRKRASSPKFQIYNTALLSATNNSSFEMVKQIPKEWGHFVESAIGQHLLNQSIRNNFQLYYWRDKNREVDFIIEVNGYLIAIEVKSGKKREIPSGLDAFSKTFKNVRSKFIVGTSGIDIGDFLTNDIDVFL